ncbi:MAG: ribonuclease Y [Phycisphaeraceae bacterium]|nr:MAG: ribonuclease Y [Phycisphaeraceae bacterium]
MAHVPLTLGLEIGGGTVVALIVGLAIGAGAVFAAMRLLGVQALNKSKAEATRLIDQAKSEATTVVERAGIDAEKAVIERSRKFEAESEQTRTELREQEKRLTKREDLLDRKLDTLAVKEEQLAKASEAVRAREEKADARARELDEALEKQSKELQRISGMSADEARDMLLERIEGDVRHDAAVRVRRIIEESELQAREKAAEITLMAIQRYAAEHTSESTVRAVPIPSDDMKGRIIGREGRNIRAIERATGVDIIVDDTPGVIVVSCFDKIRQTVAAESLQKLVADGRVHPSRIEEIVAQVRSEVNDRILKAGKDSALEVKLRGLHPKIVEAMGKLHFRVSFGQNVLRHSIEVGFLCQLIAEQLGLDGQIARRCGFLHDIGKAMDHEMEGGHPKIGMDFARQHGEKDPILNAIGGHHADIPSTSFYTPIVMAADAISSARPGARRESLEKYVQRLEQLQGIALEHKGVEEAHAIQAGREVRVMVDARSVSDDEALYIAKQIADRVSEEMTFPGEIRVTVLRETRAVEYAR